MIRMTVAVFSLGLLAGCNPPIEIELPRAAAPSVALSDSVLRLREDGKVQLARGAAPLDEAIAALGRPESTRVLLQTCSTQVDYTHLAAALKRLDQAGYRNIGLQPSGRGDACAAE